MENTGSDICELERLTYLQARRFIDERPALIVPLGGCEPMGHFGALGAESVCAASIAKKLALLCRILLAPVIPFGCSTPFIGFAGAAGVKPRTFVNMLLDILHAYIFQGIEKIFLISAAPFNVKPTVEAVNRLMTAYPQVTVLLLDINTILMRNIKDGGDKGGININTDIGSRKKNKDTGVGFDRDDALLLSIYAYLRQENFDGIDSIICSNVDEARYRTWQKRGMDPQKLRKLFPDGLLLSSGTDINSVISIECGRESFDRIVETLRKEIDTVL